MSVSTDGTLSHGFNFGRVKHKVTTESLLMSGGEDAAQGRRVAELLVDPFQVRYAACERLDSFATKGGGCLKCPDAVTNATGTLSCKGKEHSA
jgi:hypothetical protein